MCVFVLACVHTGGLVFVRSCAHWPHQVSSMERLGSERILLKVLSCVGWVPTAMSATSSALLWTVVLAVKSAGMSAVLSSIA